MKLMEKGVLDGVKQSVYEANAMDTSRTYAKPMEHMSSERTRTLQVITHHNGKANGTYE